MTAYRNATINKRAAGTPMYRIENTEVFLLERDVAVRVVRWT